MPLRRCALPGLFEGTADVAVQTMPQRAIGGAGEIGSTDQVASGPERWMNEDQ